MPLHLLAGAQSVSGKSTEARVQLAANRERQNIILGRYQHGGRAPGHHALPDRDRQAMSELAQEELLLEHRAKYAQRLTDGWFHRCQWIIRPFEVRLTRVRLEGTAMDEHLSLKDSQWSAPTRSH